MQEQVQQLQQQIIGLKVRVFDAEEALGAERQSMTKFLQNIVDIMGVAGDEQGNVTFEAIAERAKELAALEAPVAPVTVDATV